MFYIKPSWRNNISGILIVIGGIGWMGVHIPYIGDSQTLRMGLAIVLVLYGLFVVKGSLR